MALLTFVPPKKKAYSLFAFIIISTICSIILNKIEGFMPLENNYFTPICQFVIYIPIFFYKKLYKKKTIEPHNLIEKRLGNESRFTNFDYMIFAVIAFLDVMKTIPYIFLDTFEQTYCLCSRYSIQIIFIIFFSKFYSNTRYYKHNYISLAIFAILGFLIDLILIINFREKFPFTFLIFVTYVIILIIDAIVLSYKKYLFDVKLLTVEAVSSIFGIINFGFYLILMFLQNFFGKFLCINKSCDGFNDIELNALIIIVSFILNSLFYFLYYEIIYFISPNHTLLGISIFTFFYVALEYDKEVESSIVILYSILFIFIFFNLLIYLEIIELNFWGLNKYTRRNIITRERTESMKLEDFNRISNADSCRGSFNPAEYNDFKDKGPEEEEEKNKEIYFNINEPGDIL